MAVVETPQPQLTPAPQRAAGMAYDHKSGMNASNFDEAWRIAQLFARSDLVPKDYVGKAENCLVAMQMGAEIGLKPLQALQGIAVINGRPSVWGDALWALVQASDLVADAYEDFNDTRMEATCVIHRKGRSKPTIQVFTQVDAVLAGLWGKDIWKKNPKRMLQMRARAFCARDAVPDVLKGLHVAEESMDIEDTAPRAQAAATDAIAAINAQVSERQAITNDPSPTLDAVVVEKKEPVAVAQSGRADERAPSAKENAQLVTDAVSTTAGDTTKPQVDEATAIKAGDYKQAMTVACDVKAVEAVCARALLWAPTEAIKDELFSFAAQRLAALSKG